MFLRFTAHGLRYIVKGIVYSLVSMGGVIELARLHNGDQVRPMDDEMTILYRGTDEEEAARAAIRTMEEA